MEKANYTLLSYRPDGEKGMIMKTIMEKLAEQGVFICFLTDIDIPDLKYISKNAESLMPELKDGIQVKVLGFDRKSRYVHRIPC